MAQLNTLYNTGGNTTQLPNGGGTYTAPTVTPTSLFPNAQSTAPMAQPRSKYIDPATGKYFATPQDYGNYVATKIPTADIPKTAGDALTKPNQSAAELTTTATNLNNARNDIAVGATDPYKVGNQSGVAYSPTELKAIENAYAGIYDPALNDVFTRLKTKQTEDAQALQDKRTQANQILATNEAIRQWRATTGTGPTYNGTSNQFAKSQLNSGAINAGMTIEDFGNLNDDMKNFFIKNPTEPDPNQGNKQVPMFSTFTNLIKGATTGQVPIQDVKDEIMGSNLSDTVKAYFVDQLPITQPEKESAWAQIWGGIKSIF